MENRAAIARLPASFRRAGAEVGIVCVRDTFLSSTRHFDWSIVLPRQGALFWRSRYLLYFLAGLARSRCDLVIPVDEGTLVVLHRFRSLLDRVLRFLMPNSWRALNRSLPLPQCYRSVTERWVNQELAQRLGVRCPEAINATSWEDLESFVARLGWPVVLKADHTVGGRGVRICRTGEEARDAWDNFSAAGHRSILVQVYIGGDRAMRSVSTLDGRVLDGISAIKLTCHPEPTGPSATIEIVRHSELIEATEKIVGNLSLSGFSSYDFIIQHVTGAAYLIECNLRPGSICHLGSHAARLAEALGGDETSAQELTVGTKIALFPQEWVRRRREVTDMDLLLDKPIDDPRLYEMYENAWRASACS